LSRRCGHRPRTYSRIEGVAHSGRRASGASQQISTAHTAGTGARSHDSASAVGARAQRRRSAGSSAAGRASAPNVVQPASLGCRCTGKLEGVGHRRSGRFLTLCLCGSGNGEEVLTECGLTVDVRIPHTQRRLRRIRARRARCGAVRDRCANASSRTPS